MIEFWEVEDRIDRYNDLVDLSEPGAVERKTAIRIIKELKWIPGKEVYEVEKKIEEYKEVLSLIESETEVHNLILKIIEAMAYILENRK